jgi:hypothetical protein
MGFCEVEDVEALLNLSITDAADIASCERAITAVTEAIKNYCQQEIELTTDDEITLDCSGGDMLLLPEMPVVSVASVIEDGELLTVTDDYILGQYGILHRVGQDWLSGVQIITITYTHGFTTIPDDIVDVAARSAARVYQAGLRAKEHDGITGIASLSLGDYSVSYGSEHGGGVGEGVMGVSSARALLLSEKDILNRYRLIRL